MIPSLAVPVAYKDVFFSFQNNLNNKHPILEFEDYFSQYNGCKHAIAASSGTAALYVLLNAHGLQKNDEIIVPAYTCETLGRLLIDMGFAVKFVDVDKKTYNISIEDLQNKISKNTKSVLAVHMFGTPCEMDSILEISHDKGAIVIEDAAQAMGAEYGNRKVGTIGDSGFFSMGTGKPITTLGGGIIVTDDSKIANKSRKIIENFKEANNFLKLKLILKLAAYNFIQDKFVYYLIYNIIESRRVKRRECLKKCLYHNDIGLKYTDLQASLGIAQLSHLELFNNIRFKNAEFLIKNLADIPSLKTPIPPKKCRSIYLRLPIWIENIAFSQREDLIKKLQCAGIDASVAYPNSLPEFFGFDMSSYPNTEELISKTITLPTHPLVRENDLLKIISTVDKYCRN